MREMKDSGVEWIGEIPNDWELAPLRNFVTLHQHTGFKSDDPQLQFKAGHIIEKPHNGQYVKDDLSEYNHLEPNDIVINPLNLNYDFNSLRVAKADFPGYITNAYIVIHPNQQVINPTFLSYMLKSFDSEKVFHNMGRGVRKTLNFNELKAMRLPIPMQAIQTEIADYLDSKCSQIDFIVEKTRQEIEKLKEYRQSMISEAVTKGLDPDVDMKNSGVERIGRTPAAWKVGRIKNILDNTDTYPIGDGDHGLIKPDDYKDSGIPYIRVQNLTWGGNLDLSKVVYISPETNQKIRGSQLKPGDLLIAKTGATIGKVGVIPNDIPISNTTSHVGKITISKEHNPMYFLYVLTSDLVHDQLKEISAMQSTRPELGISNMKNLVITIPPREVQDKIAITLSRKTAEIDLAVKRQNQLIDKLQQYKKSLIYECVTGKKEVPSNA